MSTIEKEEDTQVVKSTRIVAIDALRGLAVCGILIVNVYQQVLARALNVSTVEVTANVPEWVSMGFVGRFFPIFSLLFGVSFALFLASASKRTDRPRMVLLRRLAFLFLFGVVHWYLHPGEVLAMYALAGVLIAMPLSFAPPKVGVVISVLIVLIASPLFGHIVLIPGMIGLGYSLGRLGLPRAMEGPAGRLATVFGVAAVLVVLGYWIGHMTVPALLGRGLGTLWALSMATAYASLFLLLLHTPLRGILMAMFAPMGRMALTNYLGATVLMLTVGRMIGIESYADVDKMVFLTLGINAFQIIFSAVWLKYFAYGPMEWVWRCLTWWQRAPLVSADLGSAGFGLHRRRLAHGTRG